MFLTRGEQNEQVRNVHLIATHNNCLIQCHLKLECCRVYQVTGKHRFYSVYQFVLITTHSKMTKRFHINCVQIQLRITIPANKFCFMPSDQEVKTSVFKFGKSLANVVVGLYVFPAIGSKTYMYSEKDKMKRTCHSCHTCLNSANIRRIREHIF